MGKLAGRHARRLDDRPAAPMPLSDYRAPHGSFDSCRSVSLYY